MERWGLEWYAQRKNNLDTTPYIVDLLKGWKILIHVLLLCILLGYLGWRMGDVCVCVCFSNEYKLLFMFGPAPLLGYLQETHTLCFSGLTHIYTRPFYRAEFLLLLRESDEYAHGACVCDLKGSVSLCRSVILRGFVFNFLWKSWGTHNVSWSYGGIKIRPSNKSNWKEEQSFPHCLQQTGCQREFCSHYTRWSDISFV